MNAAIGSLFELLALHLWISVYQHLQKRPCVLTEKLSASCTIYITLKRSLLLLTIHRYKHAFHSIHSFSSLKSWLDAFMYTVLLKLQIQPVQTKKKGQHLTWIKTDIIRYVKLHFYKERIERVSHTCTPKGSCPKATFSPVLTTKLVEEKITLVFLHHLHAPWRLTPVNHQNCVFLTCLY